MAENMHTITIDMLPREIIAHIGSFVPDPDECYAAAKCFQSLKYHAKAARFRAFPNAQALQTLYSRRPTIQTVSFSHSAFVNTDPSALSVTLQDIRTQYGDHIEYYFAFNKPYDIISLLRHLPLHKCHVILWISENDNVTNLRIPSGLNYLEMNICTCHVSDIPENAYVREMLGHCDRVHVSQAFITHDHVIDISCITNKTKSLCLKLDYFTQILKCQQKENIDVIHLDVSSYCPTSRQSQLTTFYADPSTRINVRELVISTIELTVKEYEKHYVLYTAMRYINAEAYIFVQNVHASSYTFHPMLLAYLKKADTMGIIPICKVYFMCITKDDYIAARMLQLLLSRSRDHGTQPTMFVPYLNEQPYISMYVGAWQPFSHMYNHRPLSMVDAKGIANVTDIKQLYIMFEDEKLRVLWSIVDAM